MLFIAKKTIIIIGHLSNWTTTPAPGTAVARHHAQGAVCGVCLYVADIAFKKNVLQHYWQHDIYLFMPISNKSMSCDRFLLLLKFLYFADNGNLNSNDQIWKVRDTFNVPLKVQKILISFRSWSSTSHWCCSGVASSSNNTYQAKDIALASDYLLCVTMRQELCST